MRSEERGKARRTIFLALLCAGLAAGPVLALRPRAMTTVEIVVPSLPVSPASSPEPPTAAELPGQVATAQEPPVAAAPQKAVASTSRSMEEMLAGIALG